MKNILQQIDKRCRQLVYSAGSSLLKLANRLDNQQLSDCMESDDAEEQCTISSIDHNRQYHIINRLDALMLNDRLYLNPDLSMDALAKEIGTNRTYLSEAIVSGKEGFYKYINRLRLKYFIDLVRVEEAIDLEDAVYMSGFKSMKTFCNVLNRHGSYSDICYLKNRYICKTINKMSLNRTL